MIICRTARCSRTSMTAWNSSAARSASTSAEEPASASTIRPMRCLRGLSRVNWVDAGTLVGAAKIIKTPDEVACIRHAQLVNELAMIDALKILRPGVRQVDLSAAFLRRAFELGATAGGIDPIWQVMPPVRELGPWTLHGDLAYPTVTTDRFLREGDVIWVDAGITWEGYASDYGRTWITSTDSTPNDHQQDQFRRWRSVVDAVLEILAPGVTALQLGQVAIAARGGVRPWIEHFYLGHGVGTDSAEMPLIGTDFGEEFDEHLIMEPGMVVTPRAHHLGRGCGGLPRRGHRRRHGHRMGEAQRLDVRPLRGDRVSPAARDRGVLVGVMALEDDARVDFRRLRAERRSKVLAGMERHRLDALVLGGVGNVRYVSGARQLGRAGVLPFAPVVVVIGQTARVHLMSTWDEGTPPELEREDLYGLCWNPVDLAAQLAEIPGLGGAERVGTDGLNPMFAGLLSELVTTADLVDGATVMEQARRIKTADELTCLDVASALAEAALSALEEAVAPGITERQLLGVYAEKIAGLGAPIPPSEAVCFATPTTGPVRFRRLASDRPIGDGELVVLAPGALYAGYEAGLARTTKAGRTAPAGESQPCWRIAVPGAWTPCWPPAGPAVSAPTCIERGRPRAIPSPRCRSPTGSDWVPNHR